MPCCNTPLAILTILSFLVQGQVNAQNLDPTRAKTLTVEQATELLKKPNSLRVDVTELSPEAAAVLATYKGDLRFEALATLSAEAAAALATRSSTIDLPKVATLTPAVAKALATTKSSLHLSGVKDLSTDAARELATHTGTLTLGVAELSDETAAALAQRAGDTKLDSLTSLTSLALAERLGRQNVVSLNSVRRIAPEIARALNPPADLTARDKDGKQPYRWIDIGLTELSPEAGAAIVASRHGFAMHSLESVSPEAAAAMAAPNHINMRMWGLKTLSPATAAALAKGTGILDIRFFGPEISDEAADALAKQMQSSPTRQVDLNGLKKLSSPALAVAALMKSDIRSGPHGTLAGVTEITDEVAQALAEYKGNLNGLPGLTSLKSASLAAKYAAQPGDLKFAKLTAISDDVAKALATHKGKLDLSGLQSLSDEAAKSLARHDGELLLTGLTKLSDPSAALLRANEKIKLSAKFQQP